ncbi:BREX-1 system phosphatase PglZ type A [Proteiniclasticum sp. QWL-01]|uniref:BREX-1 system phosphatase PglZ type A n=1 Tax=Proteiniclasticum sp. QWL-01 TaxID=3036945 RepID=UPI002410F6E0|nr:BREX-1 system phosphatase PglZ type A [Proteiniclasticum sp. QWL-01]WFF73556.1 BREX-1 system phosphatase PglZ type A [Proteiniclasticum sp. QWL-01]
MSTESIQFALTERFAAPLPEFYQRRIIFWQDEDREFEATLDELVIPNVKSIKLTGTNNFAVKKLLLHDDLTSNYLIYNPFSYSQPQDDWLRDIELFSEEYRADFISMQMSELNIETSPAMRKTVKLYAKFLESKERRQKLHRIGRDYQTPLQLHIDIMAVLAGLNGGSAQDVFIAVLSDGLDEEKNAALNNIKKFGNIEAFWQLVRKYTGYIHEDEKPLGFFAAHVLLTALAQTMNASVLKGLERFISDSNKAYCYSIVHEWRNHEDNSSLWDLCRSVEQELQLPSRFDKQDIETLLTADIFPSIHEVILSRFYSEVADHVVKTELMLKTAENRRTSGWYDQFSYYYDCLYFVAKMQEFYQDNAAGFHIVEPKSIWKLYADKGYEMDNFYRHFHYAFGCSLKDSNPLLEDKLKHAAEYVEAVYQNWFLKELTGCWTNAISDNLASLGYVSEIGKQRNFYAHYIKSLAGKNSRAFVIISDALRYEVASELCDTIVRTTKGTAKLDAVQAVFPSITKFGMAALLPGRRLSVNDEMEVLVEGMPTRSTPEREKVLCASNASSVAVQYNDILKMKRAERRELVGGKEVVYIYHNTIDAIGDKAPTEKKVFEACEDAMQELINLLRIVINDMQGTDIFITADHGFLYTYSPLTEGDKLGKSAFTGEVFEVGRRYAITDPATTADYLMPVQLEGEIEGTPVKGYTPQDSTRIKVSGGGENFVHGGVSLQEMVVPVIAFKNLRTTSKKYVEVSKAELKLLSESRKISNLLFSLDFFQRQPIGEKIEPCAYSVYMTDEEGTIVSDRQTIIADRTSTNASERVFRVRFNLKAGVYDKNKIYRLIIANDTDVSNEEEFHIDIAFADDFGFDL